ncbi:MAG: YaiO family outer membrane beta-barrel protein [Elusimicrobia bacterium]|nr:YaiO family outer membrane beta-barrel protein [Elusimicrobiota bacterium]
MNRWWILAAFAVPSGLWARDAGYWETKAGTEQQNYASGRTGWYTSSFSAKRMTARGDSLSLGVDRVARFTQSDNAAVVDTYVSVWPRAYTNLRVQATRKVQILPKADGFFELYQGFGHQWEASARARHMSFVGDNVDLYSLSLAKYYNEWYGQSRVTWVPSRDGVGVSREFVIRRYGGNEDEFVQLTLGRTSHSAVGAFTPGATGDQSTYAHARLQLLVRDWFGLSGTLMLEDEIHLPPRKGFSLQVFVRYND